MAAAMAQILRCFCGCTEMTVDEIQAIFEMTGAQFLNHDRTKTLFQSYLKSCNIDKSRALESLQCYDLCKLISSDPAEGTDKNFKLLYKVVPRYKWIRTLKHVRDEQAELTVCLRELLEECTFEFETHEHFSDFKAALLRKVPSKVH